MAETPHHPTRSELEAALPTMANAPKDRSVIAMIVVRPDIGQREMPNAVHISSEAGVEGDRWSKGSWLETDDGRPHPDVQVNLMCVRAAQAIAGDPEHWPAAGNNFFVDLDMSPDNMPPGTRLQMGTAQIEISEQPNKGCQRFIDSYGRDACVFVNVGPGWSWRMRGLYARVIADGDVSLGDAVLKLPT